MDAELENVRAALDWCRVEPGAAERILRRFYGISSYWDIRGHSEEACRRFEELLGLLPLGPPTPGQVIGRCFYLYVLGTMGNVAPIIPLFEETRALERQVDDLTASFWFGWIEVQYLAVIADPSGPAVARAWLAELRKWPMPLGDSLSLWYYGVALLAVGELDEAERVLQQTVDTTLLDHVRYLATDFLGMVAFRRGELAVAQRCFQQTLAGFARFSDLRICGIALEHLADVNGALGRWGRAAQLLGASEMLLDLSNKATLPVWQLQPETTSAGCRSALGEEAFAGALATGRAMTVEQAIAYALEDPTSE